MRIAASSALILLACQPSGSDDAFPVVAAGDDTVINPAADAPPADASDDASASLAGRVCVLADRRNLTSCTTPASGITVALGTATAVTAIDGTFTIAAPSGSNVQWLVTAPGFVPTVMPLGAVHLLPFVSADLYSVGLLDNGVILQAGQGSLVARVVRGGAPAVGVTATVAPASVFGPLYDGSSASVWDQDATGAFGVVWIPDAAQGTATLSLMPPAGPPVMLSLPVVDGAITFATVGIP